MVRVVRATTVAVDVRPERPTPLGTRPRAPGRTRPARVATGRPSGSAARPPAFDRAALARTIAAGLAALGLHEHLRDERNVERRTAPVAGEGLPIAPALDERPRTAPALVERLLDYLALLAKWNTTYNLTAIRDPAQMLVQHLLDSLTVVRPLAACLPQRDGAPTGSLVDVGSGAGLPGIVLAIAWPAVRVLLVESVGKKAAFLRQCCAELALTNVEVTAVRVESLDIAARGFPDLVVCRAYATLADYVRSVEHFVGPGTTVAAMKGVEPTGEIAALPPEWSVSASVPLAVPGLEARRCLVHLTRIASRGEPGGRYPPQ